MNEGTTVTMECPKCGGELTFACDPPDYDVGIMGFICWLVVPELRCGCVFTDDEQYELEDDASELAWEQEQAG